MPEYNAAARHALRGAADKNRTTLMGQHRSSPAHNRIPQLLPNL